MCRAASIRRASDARSRRAEAVEAFSADVHAVERLPALHARLHGRAAFPIALITGGMLEPAFRCIHV